MVDFFDRDLPKWPQMLVTGPQIKDEARIKDIIFRTDSFFTSVSEYSGANNHHWNNWYKDLAGINKALDKQEEIGWSKFFDLNETLRNELGFIECEYLVNNWASCSFVGGPHGWLSPEGVINFTDNVGKYPSVKEVYLEWCQVAKAFPYVEANVTLFNRSASDEGDRHAVVSMQIKEGEVEMLDADPAQLHPTYVRKGNEDHVLKFIERLKVGPRSEQGLPDEWAIEFAQKVRPLVEKIYGLN